METIKSAIWGKISGSPPPTESPATLQMRRSDSEEMQLRKKLSTYSSSAPMSTPCMKKVSEEEQETALSEGSGGIWSCSACTYINSRRTHPEQCSMCGSRNPALEEVYFFYPCTSESFAPSNCGNNSESLSSSSSSSCSPSDADSSNALLLGASPGARSFLSQQLAQQQAQQQQLQVPKDFLCPITQDIMADPVCCEDGYTYEREAIRVWIREKGTSPITRDPLPETGMFPNRVLKRQIDEFARAQQWAEKKSAVNNALASLERTDVQAFVQHVRDVHAEARELRGEMIVLDRRIADMQAQREKLGGRLGEMEKERTKRLRVLQEAVDKQAEVLEEVAAQQKTSDITDASVTRLLGGISRLRERMLRLAETEPAVEETRSSARESPKMRQLVFRPSNSPSTPALSASPSKVIITVNAHISEDDDSELSLSRENARGLQGETDDVDDINDRGASESDEDSSGSSWRDLLSL